MGPKKANRSPFGLFMIKMKRSDGSLRSMPTGNLVAHCAPIYDSLPQEVRKRLEALSQFVRQKNLNEYDINRKMDQFSLQEETGGGDIPDQSGHNQRPSTSNWTPPPPQIGFISTDGNRHEDIYPEEEEDTFTILEEVFKNTADLPKKAIIGICFNVMVYTQDNVFYPNEIGLIEFSLEEGVQQIYTKLIANEIPGGYYGTAKEFSEKYHKIPITGNNLNFEADYELLFNQIYDFMSNSGLKDSRNRNVVFCKAEDRHSGSSDISQVMGCLTFLDKKIRSLGCKTTKSLIDDFIVIDMTDLLFLTIRTYCTTLRPRTLCLESLSKSIFDFFPDMRCDFHAEDDNNYCALAVIKRTAFLFFDILFALPLRPEFDIKAKPSHRPKKHEIQSNTYELVLSDRPIPRPRAQYRPQESQPEVPVPPPNTGLKRLQRTGVGRGRLVQNLMNLQKRS